MRDVPIDTPLTEIRSTFPDLLKLNNRCTARGTKMLEEHRSNVSWRVGAREHNKGKAKKRKRGVVDTSGTSESGDTQEAEQSTINRSIGLHRCSILRTGFSKCKETEQEMFCCKTCCIEFGTFVCLECSKFCHDGHEIHSIGYGPGYCDCCVLSDCKCLGEDEEYRNN